ncbi:hypothetical protein evm_006687 [Chilo suppressalis]|nr:hypothetical protein evm_006687 [Chilo suppressalis]
MDVSLTTVFLGITLDSKLQWGPHIDKLSKRLSSAADAVMKIHCALSAKRYRYSAKSKDVTKHNAASAEQRFV